MKKIKLNDGYELKIDESIVESWEFMELLSEVEDKPLKSVQLVKLLLGEQIGGLVEHLGGHPKAEEMMEVTRYIIEHFNDDSKK